MKKIQFIFLSILIFGTLSSQERTLSLNGDLHFFNPPIESNLIQPTGVAENSKGHIFIVSKGTMKLLEFD